MDFLDDTFIYFNSESTETRSKENKKKKKRNAQKIKTKTVTTILEAIRTLRFYFAQK